MQLTEILSFHSNPMAICIFYFHLLIPLRVSSRPSRTSIASRLAPKRTVTVPPVAQKSIVKPLPTAPKKAAVATAKKEELKETASTTRNWDGGVDNCRGARVLKVESHATFERLHKDGRRVAGKET